MLVDSGWGSVGPAIAFVGIAISDSDHCINWRESSLGARFLGACAPSPFVDPQRDDYLFSAGLGLSPISGISVNGISTFRPVHGKFLKNILANYISRGNQKWLIAPQDGQIIKAKKSGLNEIVKEGEMIVEMVPTQIDHAVELFIEPMDLMLINPGQKIRMNNTREN